MLPKNKIECIALMKYFEYIGEEAALRDMPVTDLQIHEDDAFVDFMFCRRLPEGEVHSAGSEPPLLVHTVPLTS